MTPGGVIAVGAVIGFVGWLGYEIWLRDRLVSLRDLSERERRAEALAVQHHPTILDAVALSSGEVLLVVGAPTESELACERLWMLPSVEPRRVSR